MMSDAFSGQMQIRVRRLIGTFQEQYKSHPVCMDGGFIPSYILKLLIKNRNLCRDIIILVLEDHRKAILRVSICLKGSDCRFHRYGLTVQTRQAFAQKLPEVYLWLYGGELAPVRLGVRPDYNLTLYVDMSPERDLNPHDLAIKGF